jgi:uncharacterized protein (TIGR02271 family)
VSRSRIDFGNNLKPLSDLSDYKIESGDPDPRGWTVVSTDGRQVGKVDDLVVDTNVMKVKHFLINPKDGAMRDTTGDDMFLLDAADAEVRSGSRQLVARRLAGSGYAGAGASAHTGSAAASQSHGRDQKTVTRSEEEVRLGKREVERGEVVIGKHVETERVSQPVTRRREEAVIERRPVEAGARADARISDDEVRIPLREEEVVVDKKPVVKEELVVGKRVVEERDTVETDVRREKFDIDKDATRGHADTDRDRNRR